MRPVPNISDAEWEVMHVVWAQSPIAANEVVERLARTCDWHPRTIKTMLGRLVKKEALSFTVHGNRYLYRPRVTRQQYIKHASHSFLRRLFGSDPSQALMHLVEQTELSREEIEHLKRLLDNKRT